MISHHNYDLKAATDRLFPELTPWRPAGRGLEGKLEEIARLASAHFEPVSAVSAELENPNLPYAYSALWSVLDGDLNGAAESVGRIDLSSVYGALHGPEWMEDQGAPRYEASGARPPVAIEVEGSDDSGSEERPAIVNALHRAVFNMHQRLRSEGLTFDEARECVTWRFQWVVVEDFLKRVCGTELVEDLMTEMARDPSANVRVPTEFSQAAFRLAFVLRRPDDPSVDPCPSGERESGGPTFSWESVLDEDAPGAKKALLFDTRYAHSDWSEALSVAKRFGSVAFFSLLSGWDADLPSGQSVARALGVDALAGEDPLLIYILREAEQVHGGRRLGPVGGHIVARSILQALFSDPGSYLNSVDGWVPGRVEAGQEYGLAEFIEECGEALQSVCAEGVLV